MSSSTGVSFFLAVSSLFLSCAHPPTNGAVEVRRAPPAAEARLPHTFERDAIDRYLAQRVGRGDFVGLSVGIMRAGKIVFAKGYGKRSITAGDPVDATTPFAIASVSKQFTCAAALLLAQEGKLSLDDLVAEHYPNTTQASQITLLDALTHVAGYPDYYPLDFVVPGMRENVTVESVVQKYANKPLDFAPRTRWSYSNTGYLLVGRIVEKLTGQPLSTVMAERLLAPQALQSTALGAGTLPPGAAVGHMAFALGEPEVAPREGAGWLHAAGGLWSTPSDLLRWGLALVGGKVLGPQAFQTMTTTRTLLDGRDTGYGCGLRVFHQDGERVLAHGGAVNGYLTRFAVIPRTRSALAIMTNDYAADLRTLFTAILDLIIAADQGNRIPEVKGPPPDEDALALWRQMQSGRVDGARLSADFQTYLSPERVQRAAPRLRALGEPERVEVVRLYERGGMQVARLRFVFSSESKNAVLYRTPDGTIHEFQLMR